MFYFMGNVFGVLSKNHQYCCMVSHSSYGVLNMAVLIDYWTAQICPGIDYSDIADPCLEAKMGYMNRTALFPAFCLPSGNSTILTNMNNREPAELEVETLEYLITHLLSSEAS